MSLSILPDALDSKSGCAWLSLGASDLIGGATILLQYPFYGQQLVLSSFL